MKNPLPPVGSDDHAKAFALGTILARQIDAFLTEYRLAESDEMLMAAFVLLTTSFAWARNYDPLHIVQRLIEEWQRLDDEREQAMRIVAAQQAIIDHLEATGRVPVV